eukprot:gene6656-10821_t
MSQQTTFFFFIILIFFATAQVETYSDSNLNLNLKKKEFTFIMFYPPYCNISKSFAPKFEILSKEFPYVSFGKMDPEVNEKTTEEFNIMSYPSLILFKNGIEFRSYADDINETTVKNWLDRKIKTSTYTTLNTQEEIVDFVKKNENSIIGYFKTKDALNFKKFRMAHDDDKNMDDFMTGVTFDENLVATEGEGTIYVKPKDGKVVKFQGQIQKFSSWLVFNGFPPLVQNYTYTVYSRVDQNDIPLGILYFNSTDSDGTMKNIKIIEEIAEKYKNKMLFAHTDGIEFKEDLNQYDLEEEVKLPLLVIAKIKTAESYIYKEKFEKIPLTNYINKVLNDEIEPIQPKMEENFREATPEEIEQNREKFQKISPEEFEQLKSTLNKPINEAKKDEL